MTSDVDSVRTKHLGQITPRCSRAQDPEDAIEDTTVVNPRNSTRLVRQHGLDGNPFIIGEFVALRCSRFASLNINMSREKSLVQRKRSSYFGRY